MTQRDPTFYDFMGTGEGASSSSQNVPIPSPDPIVPGYPVVVVLDESTVKPRAKKLYLPPQSVEDNIVPNFLVPELIKYRANKDVALNVHANDKIIEGCKLVFDNGTPYLKGKWPKTFVKSNNLVVGDAIGFRLTREGWFEYGIKRAASTS